MKRIVVVIKCQMDRSILGADTDGNRIVGVVAPEVVVLEPNHLPLVAGKLPPGNANLPFRVVVRDVLMTLMRHQGILLKRLTIDGTAEATVDRQGLRVDNRVACFGDGELRRCRWCTPDESTAQ